MLAFLAPVTYFAQDGSGGIYGPDAVAAGDFANNGIQDLAVAGYGDVNVLMGNGHGGFAPAQNYALDGPMTTSLAVGDVNGDGKLDIVANSYGNAGR